MADSAAAHVPTRSGRVAFESEVVQQPATDAAPAMGGSDISVTDEHDVLDILQTHLPDQMAILLETPEPDPCSISCLSSARGMFGALNRSSGITPL